MRRIAAIVTIVVGVGLVTMPFALSLFSRTRAADQMTDSVRPAMNKEFIAKVNAGFSEVMGGIDELKTKVYPAVAQRLGQTPAQYEAATASKYPSVAAGVEQRQQIVERYTPFEGARRPHRRLRGGRHSAPPLDTDDSRSVGDPGARTGPCGRRCGGTVHP